VGPLVGRNYILDESFLSKSSAGLAFLKFSALIISRLLVLAFFKILGSKHYFLGENF
tara:strand:- start:110 stop:280 length:171 start_codon:yes stop_codon:yes gene_type:complete